MKRVLSIVLALMLCLSVLAGCTSSTSTSSVASESTESSSKPSSEDSSEPASSEASASNFSGTLDVWHYFTSDAEVNGMAKIGKEFMAANPDVTVSITYVPREELIKQYTMGAVSGDLPDIGMMDNPEMPAYIEMGICADVTEYFNIVSVMLAVIMLFPILWIMLNSFKPETEIFAKPITLLPKVWTGVAYSQYLVENNIIRAYMNTFIVASASLVVGMIFGVCKTASVIPRIAVPIKEISIFLRVSIGFSGAKNTSRIGLCTRSTTGTGTPSSANSAVFCNRFWTSWTISGNECGFSATFPSKTT